MTSVCVNGEEGGMRVPSRQQIESTVVDLVAPLVEQRGWELVEVEYVRDGGGFVLRVSIDKPGGVTAEDCRELSRLLSDRLDEVDPIPGAYVLEVSSPGVERPLKKPEHFERFVGHTARVATFSPVEGRKKWEGKLRGLKDGLVLLDLGERQVGIPLSQVSKAYLVFEF